MKLKTIAHVFFNAACGRSPFNAALYKQAQAKGLVLEHYRVQKNGEYIATSPALLYTPGYRDATLVFRKNNGSYHAKRLNVKMIRHTLEEHATANSWWMGDIIESNGRGYSRDYIRDTFAERAALERTIAQFEKITGMHVHDCVRHQARKYVFNETQSALSENLSRYEMIDLAIHAANNAGATGGTVAGGLPDPQDTGSDGQKEYVRGMSERAFNWVYRN